MIVDLDKLNLRELFEIRHQWTGNGVKRPVRLAIARQINVCNAIRKHKSAVAGEAIVYHRKPLIALHVTGTLEEFIEHGIDRVL